jgi:hypothetical protein
VSVFNSAVTWRSLRPLRVVGAVAAGVAVGLAWVAPLQGGSKADVDLTSSFVQARSAVGLPAVGSDPSVLAAAGAALGRGDARSAFASRGGTGTLVTATVSVAGALSSPQVKAAVFDPRVTAISVLRRRQTVAVAASLDVQQPFQAPVLAGAVADPGVAGSLAVLFPPESGAIPAISLEQNRSGERVRIEIAATRVAASQGASLVELRARDRITGPQLGYGLVYTLKIGTGRSYQVRTRPVPPVLTSRTFAPGPGFSGADRRAFLAVVDSLPPVARTIVRIIGGAITVRVLGNSAPICGGQTSCAGFDQGNGYFLILNRSQLRSSVGRFVIAHELGHLVDFLGLDSFSHQKFRKLFSVSPHWKRCFREGGRCAPFLEVFADQFGFFATDARGVQSGYNDGRLAAGAAFGGLLRSQWAFRPPQSRNPLVGFGPLSKGFEDGLHCARRDAHVSDRMRLC